MKFSEKITFTLLSALILLNLSCKKNETNTTTTPDNTAAISKQIALNLYHSLSGSVNTATNNGLKTGSTSTLKTMSVQHPCGQAVTTGTNKSTVSGDTTRSYVGNSIFTYMCNGYYNNNSVVDAYALKDTLTITETGMGFKNIYQTAQNYVVKATDANYRNVSIKGNNSGLSYASKVSGGVVTEYHRMVTDYIWDEITAQNNGEPDNLFMSGKVQFSTFITERYGKDINDARPTGAYSGTMEFLPNKLAKVSFYVNGGNNGQTYLVNFMTGEVTLIVN